MLAVVFDNEDKATQGRKALLELDHKGSLVVHAWAIIVKNADQTTTVKQSVNPGPVGTLVGTSLGSLIGLLGGSAGLIIGCALGLLAGNIADANRAFVGVDFIDDVNKELHAGRFALLADIEEDSTTPVDTCMEALGGAVFRRAVSTHADHLGAMKADLAQMKTELHQTPAAQRTKLRERINQLDSKIQEQLWQGYERREEAELGKEAEANALEDKLDVLKAPTPNTSTETGKENGQHGAENKIGEKEKVRA